jgi:two-component system, NtrC family, sensor kinase
MSPFIDEDFAKRVDASMLRAVLDLVDSAIVIRDLTGRFVAFNEGALTALGATADQLLGKAPHDPNWRAVLSDGSPVTADQSPTTLAMRTGKTTRREVMRLHLPDGTLRWLHVSAAPIRERGDGPIIAGVVHYTDITESVRSQDLLSMHEVRTAALLEGSEHGTFEWDLVTDQVARSLHVYEMLGYTPSELGGRGQDWIDLLHPEDRAPMRSLWDELRAGRHEKIEHEYRVWHRTGRWLWMRSVARVIRRDPQGRAQRVTGTIRDVTARREAEEALRRETARAEELEAKLLARSQR